MHKTLLLFVACLCSAQCFCQPVINKDSTQKKSDSSFFKKNEPVAEVSKTSLKIYPNPAKDRTTLQVTGLEPGIAIVKIMDAKGKIWREDKRLLTNGTEEITMFLLLPAGIYFISVGEKTKILKKKLVVL